MRTEQGICDMFWYTELMIINCKWIFEITIWLSLLEYKEGTDDNNCSMRSMLTIAMGYIRYKAVEVWTYVGISYARIINIMKWQR